MKIFMLEHRKHSTVYNSQLLKTMPSLKVESLLHCEILVAHHHDEMVDLINIFLLLVNFTNHNAVLTRVQATNNFVPTSPSEI